MQLNVYFTPAEVAAVEAHPDDIYIVIDVIRATTSITTMIERGAERVLIANTLEQARLAAQHVPGRLLCGERNALPLPGFDYGNSPAQFSRLDLSGRELVLTTTNGTRAFFACPERSTRLAGCFYNGRAVTAYALQLAQERGCDISIVCAAESNHFALDDATCAGYLAQELLHQSPSLYALESVHAATALYRTYMPPVLLDFCHSAREVAKVGLQEDLDFCMRLSESQAVPLITGREPETGLLVVERAQ